MRSIKAFEIQAAGSSFKALVILANEELEISNHKEVCVMSQLIGISKNAGLERNTSTFMVVFILLLITACGKKEEAPTPQVIRPVKTMTVLSAGDIFDIELPGRLRASRRVDLAFQQIGGRLIELPIAGREGDRVKKGDLLARIDPKDFKVNLRNTKGQLKEAEAALNLARKDYYRALRIQDKDSGAVSKATIDRALETLAQAQGRIQSLKAAVDDAENRLGYTYLRAPFDGVIARRFVDNFQEVQPKQPIISLQDIDYIEILTDVPENIVAMAGGDATQFTFLAEFPTAPGKQFELAFKEIATEADPGTQTYQVTFQMPQPEDLSALPGMTARVTASSENLGTSAGDIQIPAIAVVADPEGKNYVWILDKDSMTVHRQYVTLGKLTGTANAIIHEGLMGGETIVTAGVLKLEAGQKVRIWDGK